MHISFEKFFSKQQQRSAATDLFESIGQRNVNVITSMIQEYHFDGETGEWGKEVGTVIALVRGLGDRERRNARVLDLVVQVHIHPQEVEDEEEEGDQSCLMMHDHV